MITYNTKETKGIIMIDHVNLNNKSEEVRYVGSKEARFGIPDTTIDAAKERLFQLLKRYHPDLERNQINLEKFQHVMWNDTSLGCPKKGEFYLEVITPGYQIDFSVNGKYYTMHINENGSMIASPDFLELLK